MATKKKVAPAEEVQNTQEGVQNDAQRVEMPEPIEDHPKRKRAKNGRK